MHELSYGSNLSRHLWKPISSSHAIQNNFQRTTGVSCWRRSWWMKPLAFLPCRVWDPAERVAMAEAAPVQQPRPRTSRHCKTVPGKTPMLLYDSKDPHVILILALLHIRRRKVLAHWQFGSIKERCVEFRPEERPSCELGRNPAGFFLSRSLNAYSD